MTVKAAFFFFSSRRRHTRLTCDWSSDVCSSDLTMGQQTPAASSRGRGDREAAAGRPPLEALQIGRASCRESVDLGGRRVIKKKKTLRKQPRSRACKRTVGRPRQTTAALTHDGLS